MVYVDCPHTACTGQLPDCQLSNNVPDEASQNFKEPSACLAKQNDDIYHLNYKMMQYAFTSISMLILQGNILARKYLPPTRGPTAYYFAPDCHVPPLLLEHPKNTNLVEDFQYLLLFKFLQNLLSNWRVKAENVSTNQRPDNRLVHRLIQKHKLGKGCWVLAFCQLSSKSISRFWRSWKCEKLWKIFFMMDPQTDGQSYNYGSPPKSRGPIDIKFYVHVHYFITWLTL